MFLSLTLFISRLVQPVWLGIHFPPPYYVTIQSIGILVFGFFMSRHLPVLSSAAHGIRTGNKFLLSMFIMCLAYGLITYVCFLDTNTLLSPLLILPAYLLISLAELLLSPVGLAAVTILASRRKVSTMMGIFFISLGLGAFLSGKLAIITSVNQPDLPLMALKQHYAQSFKTLFLILISATLCCALLNGIIRYSLKSLTKTQVD